MMKINNQLNTLIYALTNTIAQFMLFQNFLPWLRPRFTKKYKEAQQCA